MQTRNSPARLPLVVTADGELLDDILRLAAAAGVEVEVAPDPSAARARHGAAPMVLVGADQAAACLRARLPRRPGIIVVARPFGGDLPAAAEDPDESLWQTAETLGADHVALLPTAESWLVDRLSRGSDASGAPVVAVIGGRGGAGASILAAALAMTGVRRGLRSVVIDADPLGGGIDLVLGWEELDGLRWPALRGADGRIDAPALIRALPRRGDLAAISWDRGELLDLPPQAMAGTVDAARRASDLVVVDLPRRVDDTAALALQAADRTLLVVPAELRATAAAARVAAAIAPHCVDISVVVRGPSPGRLTAGDVALSLEMPLAGTLRPEPALCRAIERGEPPAGTGRGPLAALCGRLVAELTGAAPSIAAGPPRQPARRPSRPVMATAAAAPRLAGPEVSA